MEMQLIATATFGLEAVVKREIEALGYEIVSSEDGRITFKGDERALVKANLWLRTADRVYVKLAEFKAVTFQQLIDESEKIDWAKWLPEDGKFIVTGTSVKSSLHSVPACQSTIKKSVISALSAKYGRTHFDEDGAEYGIRFSALKDRFIIMLDSSGEGLHKRGYRVKDVSAPIKETLASALVQLSFFKAGRLMADPLCGSGTIAIEAAMLARNIAPGLSRSFAAQNWAFIPAELWKEEKKAAFAAIDYDADVRILASDIDKRAVAAARANAEEAGVDDCIEFSVADAKDFDSEEEQGIIITNPPYGERIGERDDLKHIYNRLSRFCRLHPTWSLFLITSDTAFEKQFGRPANRRRKLYNGNIQTCYYQYHGERKKNTEPAE